jgi:hypothetical protein
MAGANNLGKDIPAEYAPPRTPRQERGIYDGIYDGTNGGENGPGKYIRDERLRLARSLEELGHHPALARVVSQPLHSILSASSGSVLGTFDIARSNFLRRPRLARSPRYSSVVKAEIFSANAKVTNWFIDTSSCFASSRNF